MKNHKELIKIGKISRPHGLQGFFYLKSPIQLNVQDQLFMGHAPEKTKAVIISAIKEHKGKTLIQFAEFHDRTALEAHLGKTLWAFEPEPEGLELFIREEVLDLKGKKIGTVEGFYDNGAGDVIMIANGEGMILELPFNEVYFNLDDEPDAPLVLQQDPGNFTDFWQKA